MARLKVIRKKALQNAKQLSSKDKLASHSYKIMADVIDKKISLLGVNK